MSVERKANGLNRSLRTYFGAPINDLACTNAGLNRST